MEPSESPQSAATAAVPAAARKQHGLARARPAETCSSCGTRIMGNAVTAFLCPNCGERPVGRCSQCRDQGTKYRCSACGFTGP